MIGWGLETHKSPSNVAWPNATIYWKLQFCTIIMNQQNTQNYKKFAFIQKCATWQDSEIVIQKKSEWNHGAALAWL